MSAEQTPDIAALAAEIRGAVKIRNLGPNALAILKEGGSVSLTSSEAEDAAAALAPVLAAAVREAEQRALREAADRWQTGEWTVLTAPIKAEAQPQRIIGAAQAVAEWIRDRADRITEPVSHEEGPLSEESE